MFLLEYNCNLSLNIRKKNSYASFDIYSLYFQIGRAALRHNAAQIEQSRSFRSRSTHDYKTIPSISVLPEEMETHKKTRNHSTISQIKRLSRPPLTRPSTKPPPPPPAIKNIASLPISPSTYNSWNKDVDFSPSHRIRTKREVIYNLKFDENFFHFLIHNIVEIHSVIKRIISGEANKMCSII